MLVFDFNSPRLDGCFYGVGEGVRNARLEKDRCLRDSLPPISWCPVF
jgi:hypothetical protein